MLKHNRLIRASAIAALLLSILYLPAAIAEPESLNGTSFNGTIYHLSLSQVEVTQPINASSYELTINEKAINITLVDSQGNKINMSSSYAFWKGDNIYTLTFGRHVSGKLIYTIPYQGQQFIQSINKEGPVQVILPEGYVTGDRILGIARPDPDQIKADSNSTVLTWLNASQYGMIEVNYYKTNAPKALMRTMLIIGIVGLAVLIEYYFSIKRLRAIRQDVEKKA